MTKIKFHNFHQNYWHVRSRLSIIRITANLKYYVYLAASINCVTYIWFAQYVALAVSRFRHGGRNPVNDIWHLQI